MDYTRTSGIHQARITSAFVITIDIVLFAIGVMTLISLCPLSALLTVLAIVITCLAIGVTASACRLGRAMRRETKFVA